MPACQSAFTSARGLIPIPQQGCGGGGTLLAGERGRVKSEDDNEDEEARVVIGSRFDERFVTNMQQKSQ